MLYFGIVENIKNKDVGIYGILPFNGIRNTPIDDLVDLIRKKIGYEKSENPHDAIFNFSNLFNSDDNPVKKGLNKIKIEQISEDKREHLLNLQKFGKSIIISNSVLNGQYNVKNKIDIFYGLFDKMLLLNRAFKKIMKSYGGSDLIILEKNNIPEYLKHYGGENGTFSTGIYCIHPKNSTLLIPLDNTKKLMQEFILEETISSYEALGAKKITIQEVTSINSDGSANIPKGTVEFKGEYEKMLITEKHFGKGTYDPLRAKENKLFIYDFPAVMNTINARINGNQTLESFTENINLSLGLDIDILKLFDTDVNFSYNKFWRFSVEFYDKNDF